MTDYHRSAGHTDSVAFGVHAWLRRLLRLRGVETLGLHRDRITGSSPGALGALVVAAFQLRSELDSVRDDLWAAVTDLRSDLSAMVAEHDALAEEISRLRSGGRAA